MNRHALKGRAARLTGAGMYHASCICGWVSPNRVTAQRAYRDLDEHAATEGARVKRH